MEVFRDFKVHCAKVAHALIWLKQNNHYYADITIDHKVLRSLPLDGTIDDQLQHINDDNNSTESEDDVITRIFVPIILLASREDTAIRNTLDQIQDKNCPIMWSQINGSSVNKFQTPGYITCAFLTLYPTRCANKLTCRTY